MEKHTINLDQVLRPKKLSSFATVTTPQVMSIENSV